MIRNIGSLLIVVMLGLASGATHAAGVTGADVDEVIITARRVMLSGTPRAASEGTVLAEQLENRPLLRVGELLEVVPGLIVTQHTGDGKANQYFLRGFNLDHGTDFTTRVDGVPVNLPTHAHGQGYLDLNFVIPELVDRVVYRKGTYYPEYGDFSAAGAADITYKTSAKPFIAYTGGANGYSRLVAGGSVAAASGQLLAAAEADNADGPWVLPEQLRKTNAVLKWSRHSDDAYFDLTLGDYRSRWRATDQIPLRAVERGTIDRFGFVDPTNGGETHRNSVAIRSDQDLAAGRLKFNAYAIDYGLQLFSNFTYATNPIHGDQFEQSDSRRVYGVSSSWERDIVPFHKVMTWRMGADLRRDRIDPIGIYFTQQRKRYGVLRVDDVSQSMSSVWSAVNMTLGSRARIELGGRVDRFDYDVKSSLLANSGKGREVLFSPKGSIVLGPWRETEFFIAAGRGFHSNDARGATINVDPSDSVTRAYPVTALAAARGAEVGVRTALLPRMQVSIALWQLALDSELLFSGDGGTTEAARPSRRRGVEFSWYAKPTDWMVVDADYAASRARFADRDPVGQHIPGAVDAAASLGVSVELRSGWSGGLRARYLGVASLLEDGSVRSPSSTLVNAEVSGRLNKNWKGTLGVYNLFDVRANDITYYYASQLPGEGAPVNDLHFHPVEPRTVRFSLQYNVESASSAAPGHRH